MNKKILCEKLQELFKEFELHQDSFQRHSNAVSLSIEVKNIETELQISERKRQKASNNKFFSDHLKTQYIENIEKNINILKEQHEILQQEFKGIPPVEDNTEPKVIDIVNFLKDTNSGKFMSQVVIDKNELTERFEKLILPFIKDENNGINLFVQREDNHSLTLYFESNIENFFKLNNFMSSHHLQNDFSTQGRKHISFDSYFYVPFEDHNLSVKINPIAGSVNNKDQFKKFSEENIISIPFQYNYEQNVLIEDLYLKLEKHFRDFDKNNKNIFREANTYLQNGIFEENKKHYSHTRPKI